GSILGGYSGTSFTAPDPLRFLGLLMSPSRGLFIFTPAALLAVPGLIDWRRHRAPWSAFLAAGVFGYLALYTCFWGWWGGLTYGPRFLIDVLPALTLCAVPTIERLQTAAWGRAVMLLLVGCSVLIQAVGAYCDYDTWNHFPVSVDQHHERVWDWG